MYNSLAKVKIAFLCIESLYVGFLVFSFIMFYDHWYGTHLCIIIFFGIIFILVYATIIIISLYINMKYISNFIYKINYDLHKVKKDLKWNTFILIYQLLFLLIISLFIIFLAFHWSLIYRGDRNANENRVPVFQNSTERENALNEELSRKKSENKSLKEKYKKEKIKKLIIVLYVKKTKYLTLWKIYYILNILIIEKMKIILFPMEIL